MRRLWFPFYTVYQEDEDPHDSLSPRPLPFPLSHAWSFKYDSNGWAHRHFYTGRESIIAAQVLLECIVPAALLSNFTAEGDHGLNPSLSVKYRVLYTRYTYHTSYYYSHYYYYSYSTTRVSITTP